MRISNTLSEMIKERRRKNKLGGYNNKGDFLEEIIMKDELNDGEIVSVVLDLLLAGYETTSGLLALLLYFLALSPSALHQLKVFLYFYISNILFSKNYIYIILHYNLHFRKSTLLLEVARKMVNS